LQCNLLIKSSGFIWLTVIILITKRGFILQLILLRDDKIWQQSIARMYMHGDGAIHSMGVTSTHQLKRFDAQERR
jgi:hypothetical protein